MSFNDDMQYAKDVMRIRNEMFDGTIFDGLPITASYDNNFQFKSFRLRGKSDRGARLLGDINT